MKSPLDENLGKSYQLYGINTTNSTKEAFGYKQILSIFTIFETNPHIIEGKIRELTSGILS